MLNGYQDNPCLKNGCWLHLEDAGEYVYGDLYGNGTENIWFRTINTIEQNTQWTLPEGEKVWATMPKADMIHRDGRMSTIIGKGKVFFEYDAINGGFKPIEGN